MPRDEAHSEATPGRPVDPRDALEHLDALHRFARWLTGGASEAEDLVQDTYARALGTSATLATGSNVRAWLFRIARNLYIDEARRKKKAPLAEADDHAAADAVFAREPLFGDAELDALRRVVAGSIERALEALPPDARAVVVLDLEGFTETEVAEVLGCALGTVKSRLSRAREALRRLLGEYRR